MTDQERRLELPATMEVGSAKKVIVGGNAFTVMVTCFVAVPPVPVAVRV